MAEQTPLRESLPTSPTKASDNFLKRSSKRIVEIADSPVLAPIVLLMDGAGIAVALGRGDLGFALWCGTLAAITGINTAIRLRLGK